jgi:hypothetical protein
MRRPPEHDVERRAWSSRRNGARRARRGPETPSAERATGRSGGRARLAALGGVLFGALYLWFYLVLPLRHLGETGGDFRGYHQAARALLEGRTPYLEGAFSYPPLLAVLVLPLAPLPLGTARLLWFAASQVALLGAWWLTWRMLRSTPTALAASAIVWGLAGTVPENLVLGQVNPLLVLLLAAAGALVAKRPAAAASAIGIAAALKVWPGALLVVLALRRQWRALAAGVATMAVLSVVPAVIAAALVEGPMAVGEESVPMGTAAPLNVSLPALALRIADPPRDGVMPAPWLEGSAPRGWEPLARRGWIAALVSLGVLAVAVVALARSPRSGGQPPASRRDDEGAPAAARAGVVPAARPLDFAVMTAAALLASPVTWYHYHLCQFPAMALVLERRLAARRVEAVLGLGVLYVAVARAQPWLFGRYVERWGFTGEAPAALWLATSVGPILAAGWLALLVREARRGPDPTS